MKRSSLLLVAVCLLLAACSSSHRPVYSGHEESTEGVPGFINGKKVSPHVKLGQSYSVDGETYVPRNQPEYVEEGMASWYGPGFHGGKTANGESFDTADLTAAHRTLPLPSIIRVTMVSTGKSVYVRVNDRGPFARSRILDLSRAAADKIGLLQKGVAKVRVEYMKAETERFTQLLAQGRDPKSIDLASEVLNYSAPKPVDVARADVRAQEPTASVSKPGARWKSFNPISNADAAEPPTVVESKESTAAPVSDVTTADLPQISPTGAAGAKEEDSPFAVVEAQESTAAPPPPAIEEQQAPTIAVRGDPPDDSVEPAPKVAPAPASGGYYVQLGAFLKSENAKQVQKKFSANATVEIVQRPNSKGQQLYHVRMGPYASQQQGSAALAKVKAAGGSDARVIHE